MLNAIAAKKRLHIESCQNKRPLSEFQTLAVPGNFALSKALAATPWLLIAECKLASPLKGRLNARHSVAELAALYERNGAGALSIHTDEHFAGCIEDLAAIRKTTALPLLRKDFILDEYQLFEARAAGADAVLLIAAILNDAELANLSALSKRLGMDALVEVHSLTEFERAQDLACPLIGINNRDLTTFKTNLEQTFSLLEKRRSGVCLISESGIRTAADAARLFEAGINGILVGESLVIADDPGFAAHELATGHQYTTRRNYHA